MKKKLPFFVLLLSILVSICFLSCENILSSSYNTSLSFSLSENVKRSINDTVKNVKSYTDDSELKIVATLLNDKNKVVDKKETNKKMKDDFSKSFVFKSIPFNKKYRIQIDIYYNEGKIFKGLSEDIVVTEENSTPSIDIDIVPNYNTITYKSDLNIDTSSFYKSYFITGQVILPFPYVEGYSFMGWYTDKGEKVRVLGKENYLGDVTLTAKWKKWDGVEQVQINAYTLADELINDNFLNKGDLIKLTTKTEGATIYYTTDGSEVTKTNGIVYTTPLSFTNDINIKAKAFKNGMNPSFSSEKKFSLKTFTVTFIDSITNKTIKTISKEYNEALTFSDIPPFEEEGYNFCGWFTESGLEVKEDYKVTSDLIVQSKQEIITFTISYITNTEQKKDSKQVPYGYKITLEDLSINGLSKPDFKFLGWFNNDTLINDGLIVINDISLTAHWEKYSIVSDVIFSQVGKIDKNDTVSLSCLTDGAVIYFTTDNTEPKINELNRYKSPIVVDKDMTIKAIATKNEMTNSKVSEQTYTLKTYKVTFDNQNHGQTLDPITGLYKGENVLSNQITPLSEEYFEFLGWFDGNSKVTELTNITHDVKLVAHWREFDTVENVLFSVKGEVDLGDTITLKTNTPGASIYYAIDPDALSIDSSHLYNEPIAITKEMTIKAIAIKNGMKPSAENSSSYTIKTYSVTFDNGGKGETVSTKTGFKKGDLLTAEQLPTLSFQDFDFLGWYNGSEKVEAGYEVLGDITLKANWKEQNGLPSVLFSRSGAVDYQDKVELTCSEVGAKIYYTIDGSTPSSSSTPYTTSITLTENITIKAIAIKSGFKDSEVSTENFTIRKYKVTFDNGGHGTAPNNITALNKGDKITESSLTPLKADGYTFINWTDSKGVTVDSNYIVNDNVTVTANWKIITYNITYENVAEATENNNPVTYSVEDTIIYKAPVRKGYTFEGWYTTPSFDSSTKVNGINKGSINNVIVYANWIKDIYTINYIDCEGSENNNKTSYSIDTPTFTLTNPTKPGANFIGWFTDETYNQSATTTVSLGSTGDLTFYAKWEVWQTVETVTFNPPSGALDYNETITLNTATPGATIHYQVNNGIEQTCTNGGAIKLTTDTLNIKAWATKDSMFDAKESNTSYTMKKYTVTFNNNGYGKAPNNITGLKKGDTLIASQLAINDTNLGVKFVKWTDGSTEIKAGHKIEKSLTLKANWNDLKPDPLTNVRLSQKDGIFTFTWDEPIYADFKQVVIAFNGKNVVVNKGTNKADINGSTYNFANESDITFTLTAKDNANQSSSAVNKTMTYNPYNLTLVPVKSKSKASSYLGGQNPTVIEFGDWPQTIKADDVKVDSKVVKINGWNCYKGSDNAYYVKAKGNPYSKPGSEAYKNYTFSTGTAIGEGTIYYFKMEPIKWILLNNNFNKGKQLFLCDLVQYSTIYGSNNTYNGSTARNFLIGGTGFNSFNGDTTTGSQPSFINNAFTATGRKYLKGVSGVDNIPSGDTVFLLGKNTNELQNSSLKFITDETDTPCKPRDGLGSDFAFCMGLNKNGTTQYWTRTPEPNTTDSMYYVTYTGKLGYYKTKVSSSQGIRPGICISWP